jgi:two-component system response regulator AtoC
MQPISTCDSVVRTIAWCGSPLLLVVGEAEAMFNGGVDEQAKRLYNIESASGGLPALRLLQGGLEPDLILMDMGQDVVDCLEAISRIRAFNPGLRIILFSDATDPQGLVRAFRLGVEDILPKPCDLTTFQMKLQSYLVGWRRCQHEGGGANAVEEFGDGRFFVAASQAMRQIRAQAELVAKADTPVLCLGESGTGKEVIARLLHHMSPRANRPFLKVNCAALPLDLVESELFGFERGAFTGAQRLKPGKLEMCSGGTILLDEIAGISSPLQARLLHVLEDREFTRPGGSAKIRVNARIIAAMNVDAKLAIAANTLRDALYYRLSAFVFKLPALRERREDIPILMQRFMDVFAVRYALPARPITPGLIQHCREYDWPGNIRELETFVKRYLVLGVESFDRVALDSRPAAREWATEKPHAGGMGELKQLRGQAEASAIATALDKTQWNRTAAASLLSISYKTLLHKIRLYAIDRRTHVGLKPNHVVEILKNHNP